MEDLPNGANSSSNSSAAADFPQPRYVGPPDGAQFFTFVQFAEIEQLIQSLNYPPTRTQAIQKLYSLYKVIEERRGPELGLVLWSSQGTMYSLLQELTPAYRLLSPPQLNMPESRRISQALRLFQCMATHPKSRMGLIDARIPEYFYPFLNTSEQDQQFDSLRTSCLFLICAMQTKSSGTPEIVHYLLNIQTVELCLHCMNVGGPLTRSMAARVLANILKQHEGMIYCGSYTETLLAVLKALAKMVDAFDEKPLPLSLRNVLLCYLRLSKISRCCATVNTHYPQRLTNPEYLNMACDSSTRALADEVLYSLTPRQVPTVPRANLFAGNRI